MSERCNRLMAGTGALVLAGSLAWDGAAAGAQEIPPMEKQAAPFGLEKIDVDGVPMSLYTEVWEGGGNGTTTVLRVIAGGREKFPGRITLEKVWFVNGERRVVASMLPEVVPAPANEQIRWASGVADADGDGEVDLVLQLRDGSTRYLLRAAGQPVRSLP
ncbi:MAG: hypothetical protein OEY97_03120 [Nitrospirota bacterium]|nr:hypothetical protein [Nitrospirota bacterium]